MGEASDRSRYVMGDRDEAATAANTAYKNKRVAAAGRRRPAGDDRRTVTVNITPLSAKVRITPAQAARLDQYARTRSGYITDLLRREHGITDTAGLDKAAKNAGVTRSEYIRGILLAALEDER